MFPHPRKLRYRVNFVVIMSSVTVVVINQVHTTVNVVRVFNNFAPRPSTDGVSYFTNE